MLSMRVIFLNSREYTQRKPEARTSSSSLLRWVITSPSPPIRSSPRPRPPADALGRRGRLTFQVGDDLREQPLCTKPNLRYFESMACSHVGCMRRRIAWSSGMST